MYACVKEGQLLYVRNIQEFFAKSLQGFTLNLFKYQCYYKTDLT
jgi:hypothetical protein